jgi:acyl-CoA synthetase (AMP-forming)/AMP-acid ligase II
MGSHEVMTDVCGRLREWAARQPERPLLVHGGRTYGYAEFLGRAEAAGRDLRREGCARGDRVALYLEGYDEFFVAMMGAWLAGCVVVPLNTSLPATDVAWLVGKAAPDAVVCAATLPDEICGPRRLLVTRDAEGRVHGLAAAAGEPAAAPAAPAEPGAATTADELAIIMFTSGTTGVPKGACQTASAVAANAGLVAAVTEMQPDDRIFINTPPYFTSGICHFLTLMAAGGSLAGEQGFFFGAGLLDQMEALGCTGFGGAPAHLVRVVEPLEEPREHTLRFWVSSGDHLPVPVADKFTEMLPGARLYVMYGLTEVSGRLCVLPPAELGTRVGSVGVPIGEMTVVGRRPDGEPAAPGETAELFVDGPLLMQGYLDEPELSAAALTAHGFKTGDFGRVDADGYVWVEGRKDDIIKRGGEKVSIIQVQQALLNLGLFHDVAVLAAADELLGHVPVAFVVPRDPAGFKPTRVLRELRGVLSPVAQPSRLIALDAIPRTGSGKAIRGELQALLAQELG